jgi:hypothetical protein
MSPGWFFLAAMIGMYGVANLLQSVAAAKTTAHETLDPKLLVKLVRHRTYVAGLLCQVLGFVLAFLARADLPLFLVQSSVAAGLGVTAILGVLVLKWRLPKVEIILLVALCAGLAGLVVSAEPHPSHPLNLAGVIGLLSFGGSLWRILHARLPGVTAQWRSARCRHRVRCRRGGVGRWRTSARSPRSSPTRRSTR